MIETIGFLKIPVGIEVPKFAQNRLIFDAKFDKS